MIKESKIDMLLNQMNKYLEKIVTDNQKLIQDIKLQNENVNKQCNDFSAGLQLVGVCLSPLEGTSNSRNSVNGVIYTQDESTAPSLSVFKKISETLNGTITEGDVHDSIRVENEKCIKVDFTIKLEKHEVIEAAHMNKFPVRDIVLESLQRLILYQLLLLNKNILYRGAVELKNKGIWMHVWINVGRVFVKKKNELEILVGFLNI